MMSWKNHRDKTVSLPENLLTSIFNAYLCRYQNINNEAKTNGTWKTWRNLVRINGVEATEVQVYNALGQMVKIVQGSNEVDVSGLVEGVYMMRVTDEDGRSYMARVVVKWPSHCYAAPHQGEVKLRM